MTNWYRDSYEAVQRQYGTDAEMFCALLAITSAHAMVSLYGLIGLYIFIDIPIIP